MLSESKYHFDSSINSKNVFDDMWDVHSPLFTVPKPSEDADSLAELRGWTFARMLGLGVFTRRLV